MRIEIMVEEITEDGTHTDNFEHWGYYKNPKAAINALEELQHLEEKRKSE